MNIDDSKQQDLSVHLEDPQQKGYSAAGAAAGKASEISIGTEATDSVDGWMCTFYHRMPFMNPSLKRIGFACEKADHSTGWCVLDAKSGEGLQGFVSYPADKQTNVPLRYSTGMPRDPLMQATGAPGYPITVTFFPADVTLANPAAKLQDQAGNVVPVDAKAKPGISNTISMVPKEPLKPNMVYRATVTATVGGEAWTRTWSFGTVGQ